jgi:hypothetical protein
VLNKESRLERSLEDDLLAGGYHFTPPSVVNGEGDDKKRVALLRISVAQMRMARRVLVHNLVELRRLSDASWRRSTACSAASNTSLIRRYGDSDNAALWP